ncbi:tRNA (adenosine(37)-N6)-dimethylallyltransferase MiaA [Aliiroseovarius subalbicans]|uniref:tRNA (adenosine(37)-N6)-dimethylallyltransferase MiaA n=1 Tax=Aliiroseovarius subalbicans TaxID=2925840 RepID=UPI001F578571|nr:tRNA (adenosine(37)-N6)-dimethylallyltransferase MiaA [Aliiroseovarius subalbicans]MCI2398362.1 tRNA (adenosine(37)-N6)-dimethylallyltransferase MiaA [Aliiroseovarius subalbicans]
MDDFIRDIPAKQPVLIAGPTAAGKSALALAIARDKGGVIVNADALQVFSNWRLLTARPSQADEEMAPHLLYGHVPGDQDYSVGHWLREVAPVLDGPDRPIIVGGTGLNFTALTEGLAEIPLTPPEIRAEGEALLQANGLEAMLDELDPETLARIDQRNPARVARAWEVWRTTGRGLASWQDDTPPPLLPLPATTAIVLEADRDWLRDRIARRFDAMIADGAIEEVRRNLAGWDPKAPSAKAIGAPELIAHLQGKVDLDTARRDAIVASQQYAKRQRTWFRARMRDWHKISLPDQ